MTGPYTVKVLEPCAHCEGGGEVWGEDPDTGLPDEPGLKSRCGRCDGEGERVVSPQAFETLEEARRHVGSLVNREAWASPDFAPFRAAFKAAKWLTAEGDTVSLPDGREITVEQLSPCDERCDHDGPLAWKTTEGWQILEDVGVARELIYEYGVTVYGPTALHPEVAETHGSQEGR